jgi:septum formation protein
MLAAAGVAFSVVVPGVDEDEMRANMPSGAAGQGHATANHLAERKALSVSERHPKALVIGGDQVLVCEGRLLNKAMDDREASTTLKALRGRTHELISAAVIAREQETIWRCTDVARLEMRDFSDGFLAEYLTHELPDVLGSVGCYRIEGRGAQLFTKIEGDQFTIRGMPLIPLLDALRTFGALLS